MSNNTVCMLFSAAEKRGRERWGNGVERQRKWVSLGKRRRIEMIAIPPTVTDKQIIGA